MNMAWPMALTIRKAKLYVELVKFEHTIFALPFAYLGALLARRAFPDWQDLLWITLAMIGARSGAMGLNRVIDRYIDLANPRTCNRHLPRGLLSVDEVKVFICFSLLLFVYCVYRLSPAHLSYVPVILVFLAGYSYTKRFTWLSHVFLGISTGFAPLGGWIGVAGVADPAALLLGAVVLLWIAGFDIIYAAQDLDFDRKYGLYSMPLNLGLSRALLVSRIFHALAFLLLGGIFFLLDLGLWYLAGVLVTGLLLLYEHSLVTPRDLSRVNTAFFEVNGLISIQLLVFTLLDILL